MLNVRIKIAIIACFCVLNTVAGVSYAFEKAPKGSRLNIKSTTNTKNKLTFAKGKPVYGFAKLGKSNLEIKPSKTANLYFSNYLINRNLTADNKTVTATKLTPTTVVAEVPKTNPSKAASNEANIEPAERLYFSENLQVSNAYPNPSDDYAFFDYSFTGGYNNVKIEFYNVLASPVNVNVVLDRFERKARVYVKDLTSGIYFYQLKADGKTLATKKLLVRHFN